jgi:formylglycine-generating enzyme required for sulfatase activity
MSSPTPTQPRVFVSHSHEDDPFTQRLVADLRAAGALVWVDVADIHHGDFLQRINEALEHSEWLVLVLTPAAVASQSVRMEMDAARKRPKRRRLHGVLAVLAAPLPAGTLPPQWDGLPLFHATRDYRGGVVGVFHAIGLHAPWERVDLLAAPLPLPPPQPLLTASSSPAPFPPRLAALGFARRSLGGVEVVVPPLCEVPAGAFLMGSDPAQDQDAAEHEMPQHWVTLAAYEIARFPVTVAEYAAFVRAGQPAPQDWHNQLAHPDHPVVNVFRQEALAYTAWLAQVTGQPWRLPSEAEWEKAARGDPDAGRARLYPWGGSFDPRRCNTGASHLGGTTSVGTYPTGASPYGAQDMAGNVWEWTSSLLKPYPYVAADGREGAEARGVRVVRGGSWGDTPQAARAASRFPVHSDLYHDLSGFRVICAAPGSIPRR